MSPARGIVTVLTQRRFARKSATLVVVLVAASVLIGGIVAPRAEPPSRTAPAGST